MARKYEKGVKGLNYYWLAKHYSGGDGPITLIFAKREWRDAYVAQNDYCNEDGRIREDHIYDESGQHFGHFVRMAENGKFYDEESGIEF